MESKTPKSIQSKGVTFVEIVLVMSVIVTLMVYAFVYVDPVSYRKKARDNKRLSDISTLDRAIGEFYTDFNAYPDLDSTLRTSTTLPSQLSISLYSSVSGWINEDLSNYLPKLPTDPLNDDTYYYSYIRNGGVYELNTRLELMTDLSSQDGGDDAQLYEIGNDLTLL